MIILKVTKNQGFTLPLEDRFFEKPQGDQIDPAAVLGRTKSKKLIRTLKKYQQKKNKNQENKGSTRINENNPRNEKQ